MARSLFSQSWHCVAELKPRLLPVPIARHVYRGQVWHVVQDRTGGRCHRISPAAYALIKQLDGQKTVQQIWEEACVHATGDIPTQDELLDLLIQLHAADLLQADVTPDSAALFERYQKRRQQTWKQWLMSPTSLKLPLLNPDAWLSVLAPKVAWLFGIQGIVLWLLVVVPALLLAAQHWRELTDHLSADRVLASGNLLLMALVFPFVKAMHELGHGLSTKVWGGEVREAGLMLLVFAPAPYVDTSSAAVFPSKYRRAVVGAAGMLVEVFISALALYVWLLVEPGLVRALVFNVMLISGFSTLVVNGNPLLRYDGYYILTDLIEMPNLDQRGKRYLSYLFDRYVFGAKDLDVPLESASEKRWLVFYTIAAWFYRLLVTVSIILFIANEFFIFGVLLALWSAFSICILPLWKATRHILKSPTLHRRRTFAVRLSLACILTVVLFACLVPLPMYTQSEGVIWLPEKALLRAKSPGLFQRWLIQPGAWVKRGQSVLMMEDPLLISEWRVAQAKVEEAQARYRSEQFTEPVKAHISLQQLEQERRVLARAEERYAQLVVQSETEGRLVVVKAQDMPGQFFKKGELLGYVLESSARIKGQTPFIARVVVRQDNIDLVRTRFRAVELRFAEAISNVMPASMIREMPGGIDELPNAALGSTAGGVIPTDPKDPNGLKTLERVFVFELQLPPEAKPTVFGERVYVRFQHQYEPLVMQVYRRLRQLFLGRFSV